MPIPSNSPISHLRVRRVRAGGTEAKVRDAGRPHSEKWPSPAPCSAPDLWSTSSTPTVKVARSPSGYDSFPPCGRPPERNCGFCLLKSLVYPFRDSSFEPSVVLPRPAVPATIGCFRTIEEGRRPLRPQKPHYVYHLLLVGEGESRESRNAT